MSTATITMQDHVATCLQLAADYAQKAIDVDPDDETGLADFYDYESEQYAKLALDWRAKIEAARAA